MDELIQELKREGVLRSPYVESAFRAIDRKDFVREEYRAEAYGNYPLPIGAGQTISQPYTVAFMLDLLDPQPGEKILDIGSGSGWTTALLAHIADQERKGDGGQGIGRVYAMERIPELCRFGEANVTKYNFVESGVVTFACGDGALGRPKAVPFDKILASATVKAEVPQAWRDQLTIGGVIVAPVGNSVWRLVKKTAARGAAANEPHPDETGRETEWEETEYPGFAFVPLVGADRANSDDRE